MINDNLVQENIILKLGIALFTNITKGDVFRLGAVLSSMDLDTFNDGGFWIWDYVTNQVYYSENFYKALQYKEGEFGTSFGGFDKGDSIDMARGLAQIKDLIATKSVNIFVNNIKFKKKNQEIIDVICSGSIFYKNNKPLYVVGSHKIQKKKC